MRKVKTALALAAILSAASPLLYAQETLEQSKDYFTVASEDLTLTSVEPGGDASPSEPEGFSALKDSKGAAGGIVNAGLTAWGVVNSGSPEGSYSSAYASAIPGFAFNWGNITGWKGPKELVYTYKVTNLMHVDVINVKYKISFFYGGTEDYSADGTKQVDYISQLLGANFPRDNKVHGRYITNFTVHPISVNVKWGWKFDLAVKMSDPMNIGTKLNPVAALQASLEWIRSTPFSTNGGALVYNVDGLGNFTDVTAEEKRLTGEILPVKVSETPTVTWD